VSGRTVTRIRWAFRLLILAIGLFETFWFRHDMNPDGICYLDLSDAILAGDLGTAVNGYWSPGFPVLLATVRLAFQGPEAEFLLAHIAQFFCLVFALLAFEFLLREWIRSRRDPGGAAPGTQWLVLITYPLFAWMTLALVKLPKITPDLLHAGFLLLACGQALRIGRGVTGARPGATLGLILGLGFLAKAPMLPIGLVVLFSVAVAAASLRRAFSTAGPAAAVFLLIVAGWAVALSLHAGRLTWGDTGRLNYAWHINDVRDYAHAADVAPHGKLAHPPRRVLESPATFEFDVPVAGTYPLWFDPPYWQEGVQARFEAEKQIARTRVVLGRFLRETVIPSWPLVAILAVYVVTVGGARAFRRAGSRLRRTLPLWLPGLAGLAMYSMVVMLDRYVAVLLFMVLLSLIDLVPSRPGRPRVALWVGIVTLVLTFGNVLALRNRALRENHGDEHHRVAADLRGHGIRPGDRVAFVGRAVSAYWARLGRLRIVADIPKTDQDRFWALPSSGRERVFEAFARAGCVAVFVRRKPVPRSWVPLGDSSICVRMLR